MIESVNRNCFNIIREMKYCQKVVASEKVSRFSEQFVLVHGSKIFLVLRVQLRRKNIRIREVVLQSWSSLLVSRRSHNRPQKYAMFCPEMRTHKKKVEVDKYVYTIWYAIYNKYTKHAFF